ncbi:MAG: hypothetical protein LBL59_00745 [Xanthomonadaceae bacterium]|jgi:negative regulator of sigma E activity|nr:hypothetical protein [Xanthomonadaceae bacterium]
MSQNSVGPDSGADKFEIHYRRQLSTLIDGGLPADEARFMLRRLQHDHELAGCIDRWQLYGAVMRREVRIVAPADFSQRVTAAIAAEALAVAAATRQPKRPGWVKWGGGAALAASIAAVALFVTSDPADPAATLPTTTVVAQPPDADSGTVASADEASPAVVASAAGEAIAATDIAQSGDVTATGDASPPAAAATRVVPLGRTRTVAAGPTPRATRPSAPASLRGNNVRAAAGDNAAGAIAAGASVPTTPVSAAAVPRTATPGTAQPRPWPRSSLPQSSDFFNATYSGAGTHSRVFGSLDSQMPSQALFPPANADPAPEAGRPD